ncbi:MAG: hydrogenase maturation protease [Chloroflexaceae bacterium]|nr:hydrogenase maturation protease [Chloroflexaceae bacterium]
MANRQGQTRSSRVVIVGYGNPLRRDDGVGWVIAQQLLDHPLSGLPTLHIQVIACRQLTPELAEPVSQADLVLFLDAHGPAPDEPAGNMQQTTITPEPQFVTPLLHHLTPEQLLASTLEWYGQSPAAMLITVAGSSFDYGETLTPLVAASLPTVRRQIETILMSHSERTHTR